MVKRTQKEYLEWMREFRDGWSDEIPTEIIHSIGHPK